MTKNKEDVMVETCNTCDHWDCVDVGRTIAKKSKCSELQNVLHIALDTPANFGCNRWKPFKNEEIFTGGFGSNSKKEI